MSISWDSLPNSRDAERVMLHNVINEYKKENEKLKEDNEKLKKIISDSLTRKVKTKSPGDVFDNATKKLDELHEQICQTETDYFKKLKEDPNWECGFK